MEFGKNRIPSKTTLMTSHNITRLLVIGFMIGIGYALAKAFYYGSFMGIILAMVSLLAAIYFLYTLTQARREMENEEAA